MKTLYVSDLDGTLLQSNERTSDYTNQTINRLVENGMLFSYATARSYHTSHKVTKGLNAKIPLIIYNGAMVVDNVDGAFLIKNFFNNDIKNLLDDLFTHGVFPIVYSFIDDIEKFSYIPSECTQGMKDFIESRHNDSRKNPVNTTTNLVKGEIFYITCIDEKSKLEPLYEKYKDLYHCVFQVDIYTQEQWLEIMPKNASKSNAILQLKEYLGCEKIVVFGDGKNDIDMFQIADEAYAVDNAVIELKNIATDVIEDNNADGVAKWLNANYLDEWNGEKNNSMERTDLFHKIELQSEIIEKLEFLSSQIDIKEIDCYLSRMTDITTAQAAYQKLKEYLDEGTEQMKMLFCQLECVRRIYDRYLEKGIPDAVFIATMKCFKRFIDECEVKNGRKYFDRGWWTYRQLSMRIFRIGDLEYELKEFEGENVIAIHIPSDADFSNALVEDSLKQADIFFRIYFPEYKYTKYTCNSWLLSPELKLLLPNHSNILDFQRRFEIIKVNKENNEYIEWLFQKPQDTRYDKLPESTSLQSKVKKLLLDGRSVGCAFGIME